MFNSKDRKKARDLETKIERLERERDELKETLSDLKLQKKTEEEDIKHMVRLQQEKQAVETDRKQVQMEREKQEAIAQVKDDYRDKMEDNLVQQIEKMDKMYAQILERLPNVSVRMKGDV